MVLFKCSYEENYRPLSSFEWDSLKNLWFPNTPPPPPSVYLYMSQLCCPLWVILQYSYKMQYKCTAFIPNIL